MSQARPNADQARRLFSTSARSRQRWWWKFGGAGVCLGSKRDGRDHRSPSVTIGQRVQPLKNYANKFGP